MRTLSHRTFRHLAGVALVSLFLLAPSALGQKSAEATQLKELKAAQKEDGTLLATVERRRRAVESLLGASSEDAAKALINAYEQSEREGDVLRLQDVDAALEIATLIKGQENAKTIRLPQAGLDRLAELRAQRTQIGLIRRAHVELQGVIRNRIGTLTGDEVWDYVIKDVLPSKRLPLPIRLAAADSFAQAAGRDDVVKDLVRRLSRVKRGPDVVVLCQAIAAVGESASKAAPKLLDLLEHDDSLIRDRAARALASLRVPDAIEPMIDALEEHKDDVRHAAQLSGSLKALTGVDHGTSINSWRAWWRDNETKILAGDTPLGGGMFELPEIKSEGYYFDIPQDGRSIFYVIDASGSMDEEVDVKLQQKAGGEGSKKLNRLEACKLELISALRRLTPKQSFNILWYSSEVHVWKDRMTEARPASVTEAVQWVEALTPSGSTNIYGALEKAFEFVGQGARDRYYGIAFDTMFMLTDGSPTTTDNKPDSTEKIIEAVRNWNALKRVHLHCIGIGKGVNRPFLETLARENGGQYRSY